jgi:hypothetical protein
VQAAPPVPDDEAALLLLPLDEAAALLLPLDEAAVLLLLEVALLLLDDVTVLPALPVPPVPPVSNWNVG